MRRRPVRGEGGSRASKARRHTGRLVCESLEDRRLLATFTVNNTGDADVAGTLRWAINQANSTVGDDIIAFAIPGAGAHTIAPATALPTIVEQVSINGTTQGASSTPLIVIDGSATPAGTNGLTFATQASLTSSDSIVRALAVQNFPAAGIAIEEGVEGVTIAACFTGTDDTGTTHQPNGIGIAINGAASNTIGGLIATDRNVISGNAGAGIAISGSTAESNVIQGNLIGLDAGGNTALGNQGPGILISGTATPASGAHDNTIGGALVAARNIISGNAGPGVRLTDAGTIENLVIGNYIGTNSSGTDAEGNSIGVEITGGASRNSIGGATTSLRNLISGNLTAQVAINGGNTNLVASNFIGTNDTGNAIIPGATAASVGILIQNGSTSNTVGGTTPAAGNVISGHGEAGVWIRGRVTASDPLATNNLVQGNTVGAATGGTVAVPNGTGIRLDNGTTGNTIGGVSTTARNVIAGNSGNGIALLGDATNVTQNNTIQGNFVGVASDGTTPLANTQNGILIDGALNTAVGGTVTGAANTIAFNGAAGIAIPAGTGNASRRNQIFSNGALGINLQPAGNNLQAAPVLTTAQSGGGSTVVTGTITSAASTTYTIDIYSDSSPDPSGAGEGRTFLGTTTVTTDSSGQGSFTATLSTAAASGVAITALAIAPNGDTSQFAQNIANEEIDSDLAVTMAAAVTPPTTPGQVPTNTFVTYTITVTNNGPDPASAVALTNTLPPSTTFVGGTTTQGAITHGILSVSNRIVTANLGALAVGATATITLTIVSPSAIPSTGTIVNTATATAAGSDDPIDGNNSVSVTLTVIAGVNLVVTKVVTPNPPGLGTDFAFLITVTNRSAVLANNVVLSDTLPSNVTFVTATTSQGTVSESGGVVTANLGTLPVAAGTTIPAGSSVLVTIVVRPTALGPVTNTATATSSQPQTVAGSNTATATVQVIEAAPIVIATAPTVTSVRRQGRGLQPARIVVGFSEAMDELSTERLANYRLISAGLDRRFGTADDRRIAIRSAVYNDSAQSVRLTAAPFSLHDLVRLRVIGQPAQGVRSAGGLFLDGQGDGSSGTDFRVDFEGTGPGDSGGGPTPPSPSFRSRLAFRRKAAGRQP